MGFTKAKKTIGSFAALRPNTFFYCAFLLLLTYSTLRHNYTIFEHRKDVVAEPAVKVFKKSNKLPERTYYYDTDMSSSEHAQGIKVRAWQPWTGDAVPCVKNGATPGNQKVYDKGLLFLKPQKTGSSTAASIHFRIARNEARRRADFRAGTWCSMEWRHNQASKVFPDRNRTQSYLWSILRDPTSRLVSFFFFWTVSRGQNQPLDENFFKSLRTTDGAHWWREHYMYWLSTDKYAPQGETDPVQHINKILADYDFIAVTERMDESAVALAMLMGVPLSDVLYLSSKTSGGFDDGTDKKLRCTYIMPSFISPGMNEFFQTPEFQDIVRWDHVLHQAVNRSLDLTIDKLGRSLFEEMLAKYQEGQKLAQERCLPQVRFPCSPGGEIEPYRNKSHCAWLDTGCGLDCLDEVANELNLWEPIRVDHKD